MPRHNINDNFSFDKKSLNVMLHWQLRWQQIIFGSNVTSILNLMGDFFSLQPSENQALHGGSTAFNTSYRNLT